MRKRDTKFPDNGFEAWGGYMQAKISKLEDQFVDRVSSNTESLSNIFIGVSIYVNGYTYPSADDLKSLMAQHGGIYHTYQRSDDYIIATNLPDTKVKKSNLSKIVRPEWITESIAANKLLNYKDYLLYNNFKTQPKLKFKPDNTIMTKLEVSKVEPTEKIKTAADPNFISEFYNNSRLHHISQLGTMYKQYINDLRDSSDFVFPAREILKTRVSNLIVDCSKIKFQNKKVIMHIDMDCFFVSVGLQNHPELKGKPVAVTHSKGGQAQSKRSGVDRDKEFMLYKQKFAKKLSDATGKSETELKFETRIDNIADEGDKYGSMSEIASCSYEARARGVTNGMFMGNALRLCPDLKTIPYDFEGYKEVSYVLYNTVAQYTLDIEAVSCDEMYVDCTEIIDLGIPVQEFAKHLREEIKEKTRCPCSTGFGGNRLQARLATKQAKPDGQFFLTEDLVEDYMFDIKLKDLPGVGRQTSQKLESLGHTTCGTLCNVPLNILQQNLGSKTGQQLYEQCRGIDPNPLSYYNVRKSVSAEVNYGIRFNDISQCTEFIKQLSSEVSTRMVQYKVIGKCLTLKLMIRAEDAPVETAKFLGHGFCNVVNKSSNLTKATNDSTVIETEVLNILKKQNINPTDLRGIGIQMTKLDTEKKNGIGTVAKFFKVSLNPVASTSNEYLKMEDKERERTNIRSQNIIVAENINSPKKIKSETAGSMPTTPKKLTSPVKNKLDKKIRSPTKRRGRPPKNLSLKPNNNNLSRFLNITTTTNNITQTHKTIKQTITQNNNNPSNTMLSENNIKQENVPKAEKIVDDIKTQIGKVENAENSTDNANLLNLPWQKVRELIKAWIGSGHRPLPYDIKLISMYMKELVVQKQISDLNILVKFLRRKTKEIGDEIWKKTSDEIINEVQDAMCAVYGKKLFIE